MLYYGTRLSENISRRDSATSIGAEALHPPLLVSVDLSSDETPATGGRRSFAPATAVHWCKAMPKQEWVTAIADGRKVNID